MGGKRVHPTQPVALGETTAAPMRCLVMAGRATFKKDTAMATMGAQWPTDGGNGGFNEGAIRPKS